MFSIGFLLTGGRFWLRWRKLHALSWDDILNGAAVMIVIPFVVTYRLYVSIDDTEETYPVSLNGVVEYKKDALDSSFKMAIANAMLFWAVIFLVKASFLALYWSVFNVSKRFRIAWWAVSVYILLSFCMILMSVLFHCGSPSDMTNPGII